MDDDAIRDLVRRRREAWVFMGRHPKDPASAAEFRFVASRIVSELRARKGRGLTVTHPDGEVGYLSLDSDLYGLAFTYTGNGASTIRFHYGQAAAIDSAINARWPGHESGLVAHLDARYAREAVAS
jgi:hypothetical protein